MQPADYLSFGLQAVRGHRLRSFLSALGVAIGIAAVILLTSISEGARRYLRDEFLQFGTNILTIYPGKVETLGIPGVLGGTTHKLTIEDSQALTRVSGVEKVVPIAYGQARVEAEARGRSVFVYGVTSEAPAAWKLRVGQGSFLPPADPERGGLAAVLGAKLKRELFGDGNALGRLVRIGGLRFRVLGVMAPKGRMLEFDVDDAAYVPVATAMQMFNQDELMEIDVLFTHESMTGTVVTGIRDLLADRHGGREDFTIETQTAMLEALDNVMDVITFAVGAIAGISLLVGAVGIFSIMWIAVGERTGEIGLLRALGARAADVQRLFLLEAVVLTLMGGLLGIVAGLSLAGLIHAAVPQLPVHTPRSYLLAGVLVSVLTGVFAGVAPARRSASLDPVEALHAE